MQQTKSAVRPLRSGELARLAGVSSDTLRHYERQGLLPVAQRTAAGYRQYGPAALERVQLIRGALAIGFSLAELRQILAARDWPSRQRWRFAAKTAAARRPSAERNFPIYP